MKGVKYPVQFQTAKELLEKALLASENHRIVELGHDNSVVKVIELTSFGLNFYQRNATPNEKEAIMS